MNSLLDLNPKRVFYYFNELCKIPHGSGNTAKISEYCQNFAKQHSLEYFTDDSYNVIINKPASKFYENHPAVILQGHLDMVCECTDNCNINFLTDPINAKTDGKFVFAESTTLGADNGIAVAMVLSILEDNTLSHPPIQAVFTTDEETGMYGALALDASLINARRLINIDSECEGVLTAGCAGGARAQCSFLFESCDTDFTCYKITVSGLKGGHSGIDIDKKRLNANKVMGNILSGIDCKYNLVSVSGGVKDNAIARTCTAQIASEYDLVDYINSVQKQYSSYDDIPQITLEKIPKLKSGITYTDSLKITQFLYNAPNGVVSKSQKINGLVQTSLNMGIVNLNQNVFTSTFSLRSSVAAELTALEQQITNLTKIYGGSITVGGRYPAWEYNENSPLRKIMCDTYEKLYGKPMTVDVIHAGLECGLLGQKIPNLDAVSIGPDMYDVHTPGEKLSVQSTNRTYNYLCEALKNL